MGARSAGIGKVRSGSSSERGPKLSPVRQRLCWRKGHEWQQLRLKSRLGTPVLSIGRCKKYKLEIR